MTKKRVQLLIFIGSLVVLPFLLPNYQVYILSLVGINVLAALGLNVLTGYAGQISLGHAGFLAVGGYSAAIIQAQFGLPIWLSLPLAGTVTAVVGLLLVIPALRLSEIYLAIATLGFGVAVQQLLPQLPFTGGHQGLNVSRIALDGWIEYETVLGPLRFNERVNFYFFVLAVCLVLWWITKNAIHSRIGRSFIAVRDRELAAESLGINLPIAKSRAFMLSAFLTGVAGGLYANAVGYLNVGTMGLGLSILFLAMIAIGGMASMPGTLLGAVFVTLLPHLLSGYQQWIPSFIFGAALLAAVVFLPYGLWGAWLRSQGKRDAMMRSVRDLFGKRGDQNA